MKFAGIVALAVVLFPRADAADTGSTWRSTGFLELPASADVGAMSSIAVDRQRGFVYVLHRGGTPLLRFDAHGKYLSGWGAGLFKVPHGLRIDSEGNLWITDNSLNNIRKFTPDGKLLLTLDDVGGKLKSPDDLAIAADGSLFIADTGNGRIVHATPQGKFLAQFGAKGKEPGQFTTAHGLAIDANRIYVADRGNDRVEVFSHDGKLDAVWQGFGNPYCLLMWNGRLYISLGDTHKIAEVDQQGKIVATWGSPELLKLPHFMDYGADGTLYVAEVDGKRVQMFRKSMQSSAVMGSGDPTQAQDELERAHRVLIQPEPVKSATLGTLTASLTGALPQQGSTFQKVKIQNYIDQFIFARMDRDKVPHAGLASDQEFARRVWLDATGRIPTPDELDTFLSDRRPDKRDRLIDRLTESDAFVDRWSFYFEDLFRAGSRMGSGLNLFHYWIREWLSLDRPYNEVVTDLLTGAGKTSFSVPAGMYYARDFVKAKDDPTEPDAHDLVDQNDTVDEFTITYSKVFLGINMACISCHDGARHLEKVNLYLAGKKRADFFNQAAFFGRTRQIMNWENGYQANTEFTVDDDGKGYDPKAVSIVRVPRRGVATASPHFILSGEAPKEGTNARDELARMMTGNIQFGRAFANRIWGELMGFGIVEPVDEFDLARYDPKNPPPAPWTLQPSNPELLDAMAKDFEASHYSFRHLIRTMMKSSAYQLSSSFHGEWKPEYTTYYARKFVRMLSAAELHDEIVIATAKPGETPAPGTNDGMVMQMPEPGKAPDDVKSFLRVFGQSNRDDMPKKTPQSSLQAMLLMQSRLVNERVAAKGGTRIEQLLNEKLDDRALVEKIFLATVSRRPSAPEIETALKAISADRKRGAENLQWALINSPEFIFNY